MFIGFFGFGLFPCCCFLFLFLLQKHEKDTKNAIFFSKTSFLTSRQFAKTLFWHKLTLFVFINIPRKHYENGGKQWKNLDQCLTYTLDQFKLINAQILDQFLTLQHKYIRKVLIKVHRGRGTFFSIFISCRYLVELGPRQLGLPNFSLLSLSSKKFIPQGVSGM